MKIENNRTIVEFLFDLDNDTYFELREGLNLEEDLNEDVYIDAIAEKYSNEELQNILDDTFYKNSDDPEWVEEADDWANRWL